MNDTTAERDRDSVDRAHSQIDDPGEGVVNDNQPLHLGRTDFRVIGGKGRNGFQKVRVVERRGSGRERI